MNKIKQTEEWQQNLFGKKNWAKKGKLNTSSFTVSIF